LISWYIREPISRNAHMLSGAGDNYITDPGHIEAPRAPGVEAACGAGPGGFAGELPVFESRSAALKPRVFSGKG
jgi:hypothetical protein